MSSFTQADGMMGLTVPLDGGWPLAVAYSAGRDSTALLHAACVAARSVPGAKVLALHVHHGLSAHADAWAAHGQTLCEAWAQQGLPVSFHVRRLQLQPAAGESIEALARHARYEALAEMAAQLGARTVLLAHHRRDQAETLLLQALRGGGLAGLAAMPAGVHREGVHWRRPWLNIGRDDIESYVAAHRLTYVDDDSNADTRFARNRLRHMVWPALTGAFDHAESALAHAAGRAADAQACLADWSDFKLAQVSRPGEQGSLVVQVADLLALAPPLQRELLRFWFGRVSGRTLSATLVARLTAELPVLLQQGRAGRWACGAWAVSFYRGALTCEPIRLDGGDAGLMPSQSSAQNAPAVLDLCEPGAYALPGWGGTLEVAVVAQGGVAVERMRQVHWRQRAGGETFQLGPNRPARCLRKQFQALHVPVWERSGPLVYGSDDQLIFAPGLGVDARVLAAPGLHQLGLRWIPDRMS